MLHNRSWWWSSGSRLALLWPPPLPLHVTSPFQELFLRPHQLSIANQLSSFFSPRQLPSPDAGAPVSLSLNHRIWKHSPKNTGWENLLHSLCHIWHPAVRLLVGRDWRPAGRHLCEKHLESWKDGQSEWQKLVTNKFCTFTNCWLSHLCIKIIGN